MHNKQTNLILNDLKPAWYRELLGRFTAENVQSVLDAPCGGGRFTLPLLQLGFHVTALDHSEQQLEALQNSCSKVSGASEKLRIVSSDIYRCLEIFGESAFDAIINIEYVDLSLSKTFCSLLRPGGLLFVKTYEARGQNYLQLPPTGRYREQLNGAFKLLEYQEKSAGVGDRDAVTVKLLARKMQLRL